MYAERSGVTAAPFRCPQNGLTSIRLQLARTACSIAGMPSFHAPDGTELAYHPRGDGAPLVCLPGGPGRASAYLGDLGGVSAYRQLITLDVRGTGESAVPADPDSYRCDHLVEDVAAWQDHLELDRFDLLGHSAGANIAVQYAVRYPQRVGKLVLVTGPRENGRRMRMRSAASPPREGLT